MAYLFLVLVSFALLTGFFALTQYEARTGTRFFADRRARLDTQVEQVEFIVAHVDLVAFAREEINRALSHLGHTIAHLSLQAVRATERLLTRLVRHLRTRTEEVPAPRENAREFVKTLSDFKETLKENAPDVPEVQ